MTSSAANERRPHRDSAPDDEDWRLACAAKWAASTWLLVPHLLQRPLRHFPRAMRILLT